MAAIYTTDAVLQINDYYSKVIRAKKYDNPIQTIIKRGEKPEQWKQEIEVEGATGAYSLGAPEGADFDESTLAKRVNTYLEVQLQKFRTKRGYKVTDEAELLPGYTEKKGEKALARQIRRDAEELVRSIEVTLGSAQEAVARGTSDDTIAKTRGMLCWLAKNTAHAVQPIPSEFRPQCGITGDLTDSSVFSESLFKAELLKAALEQGDGPGLDALLATHVAQALGGRGLDAHALDVHAHRARHVLAHGLAVGRELGGLAVDGAVAVDQLEATLAHERGDVAEQGDGVGALVGGVGVGEELADVARAHGAEDGVHEGVHEHVGVGVAEQARGVVDVHAAEDELAPLHEAVHVMAVAYAHQRSSPPQAARQILPSRMASTGATSSGTVTLRLSRGLSTMMTRPPACSMTMASSVPTKPSSPARR